MEAYGNSRPGAAYGPDHVGGSESGRQAPEFHAAIPSTPETIAQACGRLDDGNMDLRFCYETGPCGYGLYRQPLPSPRRPGDERINTDLRDARTLASAGSPGDLVAVWVPGEEQAAIRELVRCREDFMHDFDRINSSVERIVPESAFGRGMAIAQSHWTVIWCTTR